jgi:hypothetical protein
VTLAVVAATAAGVLDAAGLGDAVGGLVQQRPQDLGGAALEAFAADQDLVAVGACDLPAVGGEVAPVEPLAFAAGGDHQDGVGDVGVAGADGAPGVFQAGEQQAGGSVWVGGVVGFGLLSCSFGWARQASNLRPADYESAALTD